MRARTCVCYTISWMDIQRTDFSANHILHRIRNKAEAFWSRERERRPLMIFHEAAQRVPAYKDFLKKNHVQSDKIKTFKDFELVPPTSKKNYLQKYPFEKLCWDGSLKKPLVLTATSGSTGEPFYFPRMENVDRQSAVLHKMFLDYVPEHRAESTLVIVCFGMGAWVGGLITYQAFRTIAAESGYPLSLFTPGPNKKEIFEGIKSVGLKFDRLILCGYPPFLKDVIDEGPQHGINWKKFSTRIVFAAESFSEEFRDYMMRATDIRNPYTGTMNIYGSADLGTMAEETPVAILGRRLALTYPKLYEQLFHHAHRLPTLAQFHPGFTNFESAGGEILCTGDNALPLVRYAIGDHGGVVSFREFTEIFAENKVDIRKEAARQGLLKTIVEFPFVYIYERSDLSTKLYGAIIYPEHVKHGTYHTSVAKHISGKFTMFTRFDRRHNEYLEINIELKPGVRPTKDIERSVEHAVSESLLKHNAEHRNNATLMPGKVSPRIILWKHEHPLHFKPGAKQKWIKKE